MIDAQEQQLWGEARDAYGSATAVGELLRELANEDVHASKAAAGELWSRLVHQGTVYEASVRAIGPLGAIACDQSLQQHARHGAAALLAGIACGASDDRSVSAAAKDALRAWASRDLALLLRSDIGDLQRAALVVAAAFPQAREVHVLVDELCVSPDACTAAAAQLARHARRGAAPFEEVHELLRPFPAALDFLEGVHTTSALDSAALAELAFELL